MFLTPFASIIRSSINCNSSHWWLLLQFIVLLMMDAKGVRNMQRIFVVANKHNTARVASCWFIIYYRLVMHGYSNIKFHEVLL